MVVIILVTQVVLFGIVTHVEIQVILLVIQDAQKIDVLDPVVLCVLVVKLVAHPVNRVVRLIVDQAVVMEHVKVVKVDVVLMLVEAVIVAPDALVLVLVLVLVIVMDHVLVLVEEDVLRHVLVLVLETVIVGVREEKAKKNNPTRTFVLSGYVSPVRKTSA